MFVIAVPTAAFGSPVRPAVAPSIFSTESRIICVACSVAPTMASSSSAAVGRCLSWISSGRSAAISVLACRMKRQSPSSSAYRLSSLAVMPPRKVATTPWTTFSISLRSIGRKSIPGSCSSTSRLRAWGTEFGNALIGNASEIADDAGDLLLQGRGVERFDDVVVDAGFLGGDDVLGLALGRDHDEGCPLQLHVGAHFLEQLQPCHRLHVPVRDDQAVILAGAQLFQGARAALGLVDVLEPELIEQVLEDATHRVVVVDDQDIHVWIGHALHPVD